MGGSGKRDATRRRIVETAARAIRRGGYQGVGIAEIMKSAGLTHGGFYAHFANREALLVEAIEHAGAASKAALEEAAARCEARGDDRFTALVRTYLANAHISAIEEGCPIAALLSEMPRQSSAVQAAARRRVRAFIATVADRLPAGCDARDADPIAVRLVGALQMARALGDGPEGRAFLAAQRAALLQAYRKTTTAA